MTDAIDNTAAVRLNSDEIRLSKSLLFLIQERNARETLPFSGVFNGYQLLRRENADLRRHGIKSDQELIILRNKVSEGLNSGEASAAMRIMQEELSKLQGEVTEKYRGQAEYVSEQLRLMKRVQELEESLRLSNLNLEKLQIEHGESMSRGSDLENQLIEHADDNTLLRAELANVRELLLKAEIESERLKAESQIIVSRVLDDKQRMLEEVNSMNDELKALRANRNTKLLSVASEPLMRFKSNVSDSERTDIRRESYSESDGVPSRCRRSLSAHGSAVNDICFNEFGSIIGTAGDDGTVKIWDSNTCLCRTTLAAGGKGGGHLSMLHIALHGDMVAAGCSDNSARVWSHASSRQVAHLTGHHQKVCAVVWWDDGRHLVTGSHDCSIKVWDLERQWNSSPTLMRASSKCNAMDCGEGNKSTIISGHFDGSLYFWDARAAKRMHRIPSIHADQITSVQCSGSNVLTASRDNSLKLIDSRTFKTVACLSHDHYRVSSTFGRVCLSPDGRYAAAGSLDRLVYVWDISSERVSAQLESHAAPVIACHWCPGRGSQLASCDKSGDISLWA